MPSTHLTLSGYEKLHGELDYLRRTKRQEITALLRDSIGGFEIDGDNDPEFELAKDQQAFIEGRIRELETLLSDPDIIDNHLHGETVDIGSRVLITENNEGPLSYTIVGPVEASPVHGLISYASPLGSALIGHRSGDDVIVNAPGGVYQVHIIEVT
ncbi:MAG: GreA/GreB family elongation factor [Anaerolineales bacterium]|nr:GreA/GreB family elongation factor [Anaerolineales bacterium]